MVIIHHEIQVSQTTVCGLVVENFRGNPNQYAVDLAHAVRKTEFTFKPTQLCRHCWEHHIEKLADMLTAPDNEIVEEG